MDLERQWQERVAEVANAYRALPEREREGVAAVASRMMEQKRALETLVAQVDAPSRCAGCGGACCVSGRYHFTCADLLVYLVTGAELFTPLFANGLCPYLGPAGCLIATAYRPFNCISFNCELIEDLLPEREVARFYALERELRRSYAEIRALFPDHSMHGALLRE